MSALSDEPVLGRVGVAPWLEHPDISAEVLRLCERFSVADLCVASLLCDSHPPENTAFVTVDQHNQISQLSYGELADRSKRLAHALRNRGIKRGDRVGVLMSKTAQLPVVLLAIWRLGAIHVPLFTAFAGPAILQRMDGADAELIIADVSQLPKLDDSLRSILTAGDEIERLIAAHPPLEASEAIGPDGVFILLYTSGTTGTPKGVAVPAFAIASFISYMTYGLDLVESDVYWNAADPGWAYGLYYAIVGPLAVGRPNILLEGGFSAQSTKWVIDELSVTNFASSPTVYRVLKRDDIALAQPLRVASSCGEPLTPDVVEWAPGALGTEVHDQWGQTEHGMAIVNSWDPRLRRAVKAGSMGQALPGFVGGTRGSEILLSVAESPLMWFTGYLGAPQQTAERFAEGGTWYISGDVGREQAGDFFFSSRDDDVILAAGYRIAPFDIECILASDGEVTEAAVVGRPDEIRGEVIEAFVVLASSDPSKDLVDRLQSMVREGYGAHAYPRRVHVVPSLPKTSSGKVQRSVLRAMTDVEVASFSDRR